MGQIFGNIVPMIISSEIVGIMKSICDIFMKTLCGGIMMNYIPKNRGVLFLLSKDENRKDNIGELLNQKHPNSKMKPD